MKARRRVLVAFIASLMAIIGFVGGFRLRGELVVVETSRPAPNSAVRYEFPAQPMDMELIGNTGYASLADGQILRVAVDATDVTWTQAAEGLPFPRGLAITEDTVYAVVVGPEPCTRGEDGCPDEVMDREIRNISAADARVVALPILADGTLGEPRTLVDTLPTVNRDHSVNDLDMGPDGFLYLSVGGVDYLWEAPDRIGEIDQVHRDRLGTVLRVDPATGRTVVWVRGLRNVYGLAFNADGRLFAVDNDGPTVGGYRHEELLELHEGTNLGYPLEGTYGPFLVRDDFPIYTLDGVGHGGIAWMDGGVVVGSCGLIQTVPFVQAPNGSYEVRLARDVRTISVFDGCATSISVAGDSLLVTVAAQPGGVMVVPLPAAP